ncbi:venom protein 302-like isoform X2 [Centruroides vittatus]
MNMYFVFTLCVLFCMENTISALTCLACDQNTCEKKTEEDCPAGLTRDVCECCVICAKDIGERCGGIWNMYGKCGRNLKCVNPSNPLTTFDYANEYGICLPIRE